MDIYLKKLATYLFDTSFSIPLIVLLYLNQFVAIPDYEKSKNHSSLFLKN